MLKFHPMRTVIVVVLGASLILGSTALGQVTEANAPAMMQDLAKKHQAWGPKLNSLGVSIKLREVERSSPKIWYEMQATGFPSGLTYTIVTWPANKLAPQQGMTNLRIDSSGRVICDNGPIRLQFSPVKSEPIRIALVSDDEKHLRAVVNFAPVPNRASDKGCSLEDIMLAPNSALVAIQGAGFKPNADVKFVSESEGEKHDGQIKADSEGNFFFAIGQGVKGKEKGVTKMSVVSSECSVPLSIPWGKDSYEHW